MLEHNLLNLPSSLSLPARASTQTHTHTHTHTLRSHPFGEGRSTHMDGSHVVGIAGCCAEPRHTPCDSVDLQLPHMAQERPHEDTEMQAHLQHHTIRLFVGCPLMVGGTATAISHTHTHTHTHLIPSTRPWTVTLVLKRARQ